MENKTLSEIAEETLNKYDPHPDYHNQAVIVNPNGGNIPLDSFIECLEKAYNEYLSEHDKSIMDDMYKGE